MIRDKNSVKNFKVPKLLIASLIALLALAAIGTTFAFLIYSSVSVKNEFTPATVSCSIEETVEDGIKSSVKVRNSGTTAVWVRAAVIANTVDGDGNITGAADVSTHLAASGWVKSGKYYYYTQPVAPNALTGELLSSSIALTELQVTVLAEAIQSEPSDAALDAWGVNPASLDT